MRADQQHCTKGLEGASEWIEIQTPVAQRLLCPKVGLLCIMWALLVLVRVGLIFKFVSLKVGLVMVMPVWCGNMPQSGLIWYRLV